MPFDAVDPRQSFPDLERGILKYWKEEDTFKRSIRQRSVSRGDVLEGVAGGDKEERFSFYDGPPFATGLPHYGHLLAGTIKDVIPRYQTMRGKRVERRFGWDCHGLPVENIIEKEHNLTSKKQIEEMGVKAFNALCRKAVVRFTKEWRVVVERVGRWVDMDHDYRTMDPDYMESIWWVFKSLADKKLITEGHKPMHVCPRCQTPLSNFEVTQGYKDVTDVAATVMFELRDEPGTFVLAWTTTPWTLPGNLFLATSKNLRYARVRAGGKTFVVAENRVADTFKGTEHEVEGKPFGGDKLFGKSYVPLFPYFEGEYGTRAFRVVDGTDFVTADDGTGVVHIATGFGEDDYLVGKREGIDPPLQHVGMDGRFRAEVKDFAGQDVKPKDDPSKTDRKIAEWLEKNGKLFKKESYKHSYPHCWRCDSPLLNYATSSWFVAVERIKKDLLDANGKTRWVPGHIRDGRFGKWLENARDWAVSRNRYWGTPLPIWRNVDTGDMEVLSGRDDLMKRCSVRFTKLTVLRHGESEGNVSPRYQGKVPGTDLTANGRKQAERTGEVLRTEAVARIYCSPLARTLQTAEAIAKKTGAEVVVDERLREVEFGEYEGKSVDWSDLTFVKARRAHKFETGKVESIYHFPGMETWTQVQARVAAFLEEVLPRHRGEHVVVVTHADPAINVNHYFTKEDPGKLCNQPYPRFAEPKTYYWDHDEEKEMDLHKEVVDGISWPGSAHESSVKMTLVRHGQTDWNVSLTCQGQEDRTLTEEGRKQAKERAKNLKGKTFDVMITSDLSRCVETAEIIGKEIGLPIAEKWPSLRERHFGSWQGKHIPELLKEFPCENLEQKKFAFHTATPEGGESLSQYLARVRGAYEELLKRFPGKRVLVVAHGGTVQCMRTIVENLSYAEGRDAAPENAAALEMELHPPLRRIPEVLDCWFESGSMPYAQSHFPFERSLEPPKKGKEMLPPGFPADFIAEGIDQTRGWFYTLMVLSTALYGRPAFMNCVVNGTVLAEDGKKMSKRLKNYPEPLEVVERHGADAVRFALMSSPAVRGEDLRFSERGVEEVLRNVLLPLWNTYAFFVTYANAAKWEPTATRRTSGHPLDQWIRAEVQDLVNRMTGEFERYDLSATCAELNATIDALTNWYVRLSRRRFAGKAGLHGHEEALEEMNEEERLSALSTLYETLITLAQLLAPFCPFVAEAMYLNLVPEPHGSVHLTDWPAERPLAAKEEKLLRKTRLLRSIVSLGLSIRSEKKIRLRQPLAKATIVVPPDLLKDDEITVSEQQLLQEELNVRNLSLQTEVDEGMGRSVALVNARKVGPRLGARVQEIIQAGKRGDFITRDDGAIVIMEEVLAPDEATVVFQGKEGEDVMADKGVIVSLDTRITPELESQGKARELIRHIQQLRKDAGLSVGDRIELSIEGMEEVVAAHRDTIASAVNASFGKVDAEASIVEVDGDEVSIRFRKA